MHDWPALMMRDRARVSAAASRSASASTMLGSEPPSSSTAGLISAAATLATADPPRDDPVNDTAWTRRSRMTAATSSVASGRLRNAPGGAPVADSARAKTSPIASAHPGTCGSCLSTPVLPAISAGAAKRRASQKGAFHGRTPSTVPSGRCCT
ncbi:hypothetical protein JCM11754A_24260 [Isoptericola variabilis]